MRSWDNHVRGVLRFRSRAALDRGLKAFATQSYAGSLDVSHLTIDGLVLTVDHAFEIEAERDVWPGLVALAWEATDGVVTRLDRRAETENVRVVICPRPGTRRGDGWVKHAFTTGTPSAVGREAEVREKRRALGLDEPEPARAARCHVALLTVTRRVETMKALQSALGMGMAASRALLDALPGWAAEGVPAERAEAARVALEAAGATVRVDPT